MNTPSNLQINEKATLNFFKSGKIENCEIAAVTFTEGMVFYDVRIPVSDESTEEGYMTTIETVHAAFVQRPA